MKLAKIILWLERRPDGGLRVYSPHVKGLVFSGPDPALVMSDVIPALIQMNAMPEIPPSEKDPDQIDLEEYLNSH